MTKNVAGVPANHSSEQSSVADTLDHAQSDDALNSAPDGEIAAAQPMGGTYTWQAGAMSAWQDNSDYREFFEAGHCPESRLTWPKSVYDGDYDDNGGIPLAAGHARGAFDAVRSPPKDDVDPIRDQLPIGLNAVIVRRV